MRCECGHTDTFHEDSTGSCEECECRHFDCDPDWEPADPEGWEGAFTDNNEGCARTPRTGYVSRGGVNFTEAGVGRDNAVQKGGDALRPISTHFGQIWPRLKQKAGPPK